MEDLSDEKGVLPSTVLKTKTEDKIDFSFILKFDVITVKILQKYS